MLSDKITTTAFIISLTGHCLLLSISGINFPSIRKNIPTEFTAKIEIEKPSVLPKKLKEVVKKAKPIEPEEIVTEAKPIEPEEEVVTETINEPPDITQEVMLRYQNIVRQMIEEKKEYPYWAKIRGIEGRVHLKFVILSNGEVQNIEIVRSSGSSILDKEAISTIKRASPFPPIPKELELSLIQMEIPIIFALQ